MKHVFCFGSDNKSKVEDILEKDPLSRLSITQRKCKSLGFDEDGSFLVLEGDEEFLEEANSQLEGIVGVVEGEDRDEVLEKIEQEERESMEGFGSIFG